MLEEKVVSYYYCTLSPKLPRTFNVSLSYFDDSKKEKFQENIKLELSVYENLRYTMKKDLTDLVKVLEKIERHIKS